METMPTVLIISIPRPFQKRRVLSSIWNLEPRTRWRKFRFRQRPARKGWQRNRIRCLMSPQPGKNNRPGHREDGFIMIEVNERIEVASAPRTVWDLLSDPRAVIDCVPGATLGEQHEDGSFDATLIVKFGPAKVTFKAKVALEMDPAAMTGRVDARGRDNQGGTRVHAKMTFSVEQ